MSESSTEYADPGWPHEPSEEARASGPWAPIDTPDPIRDAPAPPPGARAPGREAA